MNNKIFEQERKEFKIMRVITGGSWKENSYLIYDLRQNIQYVVDPGYGCYPLLKPFIDNGSQSDVKRFILVTHPHHDHIAGAEELSEKTSLPCLINPEDKRVYMHVSTYALKFSGHMLKRPENVQWIDKKTEEALMDNGVEVIKTPGHTAGSVCYDFGEFIITGDTLLKEKIGRTDLPGSDRSSLDKSIDTLTSLSDKIIYPGHGEYWNIEHARIWWDKNRKNAEELNTFI